MHVRAAGIDHDRASLIGRDIRQSPASQSVVHQVFGWRPSKQRELRPYDIEERPIPPRVAAMVRRDHDLYVCDPLTVAGEDVFPGIVVRVTAKQDAASRCPPQDDVAGVVEVAALVGRANQATSWRQHVQAVVHFSRRCHRVPKRALVARM